MGQYFVSVYFKWQIGVLVNVENDLIEVSFPFISIFIGLQKTATGILIFGIEL